MSTQHNTTIADQNFESFNYYFLTTELEIQMTKVTENNKEEVEDQIKRLKKADNYFLTLQDVVLRKASYLQELSGQELSGK